MSFAQLTLAKRIGCQVIMVCSHPKRLELLRSEGIETIERNGAQGDDFEQGFLNVIAERTRGRGVSIFIDNIGAPVHRITLKALARQGVMTTCGWKLGMRTQVAPSDRVPEPTHPCSHSLCQVPGRDRCRPICREARLDAALRPSRLAVGRNTGYVSESTRPGISPTTSRSLLSTPDFAWMNR